MTTESHQVIANCRCGRIKGSRVGDVLAFKGIPYALPPVGARRFRPPEAVPPWTGVLNATAFGSIAPQWPTPLEELHGTTKLPQSEDCLTLNAWTPACDAARRPVLVWIHGGSFLTGCGQASIYDGTSFAAHEDVVLVTLNYRLNAFGFLHLAGLIEQEDDSTNQGLLDQVQALVWVRDNIQALGGDPDNVTVAGESAGAMSVGTLLGMPRAVGLFQRAILQSGACANSLTAAQASEFTVALLASAGLQADEAGLARLRAMKPDEILTHTGAVLQQRARSRSSADLGFDLGPVVDGVVVPQPPLAAVTSGLSRDVPLMIGTTADELEVLQIELPSFYAFDQLELRRRFAHVFGARHEEAWQAYLSATGAGRNPWTLVDCDRFFWWPAMQLAEAQHQAGGAAWLYLFKYPARGFGGRCGAFHLFEVPFVFNTLEQGIAVPALAGASPTDHALARVMQHTWATFARTGNPNHASLPVWEPYQPQTRRTLLFDQQITVATDPDRDRRLLMTEAKSGSSPAVIAR